MIIRRVESGEVRKSPALHVGLASILAATLLCAAGRAHAVRYEVRPGEPNLVRFESKAPLESFDGKTRAATGFIELNPDALGDSIELTISVDLASLDTGIPLRNRHMRENHLETARHPVAVFRGGRLTGLAGRALPPGQTLRGEMEGSFLLHGVERPLQVPFEVTREQDDGSDRLRVRASFGVRLADHEIARPQFLALKLQDTQQVTVELAATRVP